MKSLRFAFACLLSVPLSCLYAQDAELNGIVRDASGAVVSKSAVRVLNKETGASRSAETNESGLYAVTSLRPGLYDVDVSAPGFKKFVRKDLELRVAQKATLDFTLELGSVQESVTVQGGNETLETSTAQLGTVVTPEKIVDLPLNARNFTQLITLTPGASPVSVAENSGGFLFVPRVGRSYFPAINGQSNRSNSFTLDGVYNNGNYGGTYAISPNVDALSEFKVQSHSDLAEYGGASGGVVNLVTRSGSNEFHGTLYEFLRNDALDARGFFTASKPPLRQNQFGATGGGRIVKDRTFFFASYEGYRQVNPSSALTRVPTPEQLGGNFSSSSRQIFDPFSTRADSAAAGRFIRTAFPGNVIPASRFDASMVAWAKAVIPAPINTGFAGFNQRNDDPQTFPNNQYNVRGDHRFSDTRSIWGRYTSNSQNTRSANSLPGTYSLTQLPASNLGVGYVHVLGANSVVTGLFGYSKMRHRGAPFITSQKLVDQGLFPGLPKSPNFNAPGVSIPGLFGIPSDTRNRGPQEGYHGQADWSRLVGRHAIKIGGGAVVMRYHTDETDGALRFADLQTGDLNSPGNTGQDIASFMLGVVDSWAYRDRKYSLEAQTWHGYVQDSFKVNSRLTVNFGVRWDLLRNAAFTRNFPSMWDFNTGKYIVGSTRSPDCSVSKAAPCLSDPNNAYVRDNVVFTGSSKFRKDDYKMFGPRFGFAYRLKSDMVVRGSYAIFYDLLAGSTQQAQNPIGAWPNTALVSVPANRTLVTAVASNLTQGSDPRIPIATPLNSYNYYYDPNFQAPYSQQWHLEIQKEFAGDTQFTIGYVGSHNLRLPIGGDYNTALTPGPGPDRARALWPNAPVSLYDRSIGQSGYNSLQAKLDKRFSKGISYLLSYTWSKSIDTGSSGQFGVESGSIQDPYNPNGSRSVSGFDIPHIFSSAFVYELPFGPGRRWARSGAAARILGAWQLNSIFQLRGGQPYTLFTNADVANIGAIDQSTRARPDLIGNPHLSEPTPARWFNTAAYAVPRQFTFGSSGRNQLRTDGFANVDFSIFREDSFGERIHTQLRIEAFNLFNHPTFGTPQTLISSPTFGRVSGTISTARQIQLGLKLSF